VVAVARVVRIAVRVAVIVDVDQEATAVVPAAIVTAGAAARVATGAAKAPRKWISRS
jgi:hypothetical protein